jgi:hypothetical protein
MKTLAALLLSAILAACAVTPQSPAQTIYQLTSNYNAAATVIIAYKNLPPCPAATALCSDPAIVAKLKQADQIAYSALVAAENTVRTPGAGANAATAAVAAQQAIAALAAIAATLQTK